MLQLDRELIFFPIMGALGAALVGAVAAGVFGATGTFDRLGGGDQAEFNVVDLIIALIAYFGGLYMVIFFNSALVAAARERLEGGDPNVMSGIRAVRGMWLAILGWTIITGTVGLILQALQSMARGEQPRRDANRRDDPRGVVADRLGLHHVLRDSRARRRTHRADCRDSPVRRSAAPTPGASNSRPASRSS